VRRLTQKVLAGVAGVLAALTLAWCDSRLLGHPGALPPSDPMERRP